MISLRNICKTYKTRRGSRVVLADVSHDFPPGLNTGILGRNGAGKSTMMRIISGSEMPDKGTVLRQGRISWPLGFSGGFNSTLTGRENMRFTCRLYNEDYRRVCEFVEDFAELGEYMDMPIHTYSSGMRAKLAFGLSMAFEFDYYLIDEATAVGDAAFKRKSQAYFNERRKSTTLLVVSHNMSTIRSLCQKMLVLHEGKLRAFPSNEEAEQFYVDVCCGGKIKRKKTRGVREKAGEKTHARKKGEGENGRKNKRKAREKEAEKTHERVSGGGKNGRKTREKEAEKTHGRVNERKTTTRQDRRAR